MLIYRLVFFLNYGNPVFEQTRTFQRALAPHNMAVTFTHFLHRFYDVSFRRQKEGGLKAKQPTCVRNKKIIYSLIMLRS